MIKCDICNSEQNVKHLKILKKCLSCNHIYATTDLSNEQIAKIYKNNYFFGEEYINYYNEEKCLKQNFVSRQKYINKFLTQNHNQMLEIGCAFGFYLDTVKNKFKKIEGIDISKDAIKKIKNKEFNVYDGDFLEFQYKQKSFDYVCMWDTIEHLKSPRKYITKIFKILKKDGIFAFTTGDIGSLNAKFRKHKWRMIHPPTHLHYFSRTSIEKFLTSQGFKILDIKYPGVYRTFDNIIYNLFVLRNNSPWVYKICKNLGITKLSFKINLYDIMLVIAQKE